MEHAPARALYQARLPPRRQKSEKCRSHETEMATTKERKCFLPFMIFPIKYLKPSDEVSICSIL
ncbi:MAG: hypothetical protein ACOC35_12530 [Promethearchaeia archaeon]